MKEKKPSKVNYFSRRPWLSSEGPGSPLEAYELLKSRPHFLTQPSQLRTPISNPKGMQVQLIWELHFENYCSSLAGWGSSYLVKFLTLRCFSCSEPWTSPWSVLLFPVPFLSGESPWSLLVCGSNGPALARVSGWPWRLSVLCQGQWLKQWEPPGHWQERRAVV